MLDTYTTDLIGSLNPKLLDAMREFGETHPVVEAWHDYPDVDAATRERTYEWDAREASEAFAAALTEHGITGRVVYVEAPEGVAVEPHWWVRTEVDGEEVNVDWTARRYRHLDSVGQPLHRDLPCPLVWLSGDTLAFRHNTHPVAGRFATLVDPGLVAGTCRESEHEPEVECDRPADHTCSEGVERCMVHCTCTLEQPTTVDVAIVFQLDGVTDPAQACRDVLRQVREHLPADSTLNFEVADVETSETLYLTLNGTQLSGKPRHPDGPGAPLYTEAEPLGPTDAGDAGGEAQLLTAFSRRFVRTLSDGEHYGVVDVECMVVNLNQGDPDAPVRPVLSQSFGFTVCTDPANPGGTEIQSYSAYAPDQERAPGEPPYTDDDVRAVCAAFDPAVLTWNGEPVEGTDYPH